MGGGGLRVVTMLTAVSVGQVVFFVLFYKLKIKYVACKAASFRRGF